MQRKVKLPETLITKLTHLPESGMGYQNVTVTLKDGTKLTKKKVVNSEFLLLQKTEHYDTQDFKNIELENK
ncbi:MAG: hypothetical protein KAT05_12620 [Spirochaetes bacterium]|nr:hypothetical protein [Spirochaetota bacterium]